MPEHALNLFESIFFSDQIPALRLTPQPGKIRIRDENMRRIGRERPVFEVIYTAVEQQRLGIRVEKHRRERVVLVVNDQLPFRRLQKRVGERLGRKIRVEGDHGEPGRVKEQNHHDRRGNKTRGRFQPEHAQNANHKGNSSHNERHTQIRKRRQSQIA